MSTLQGPVLVVGTGLIGTSVALALRRAEVEVLLRDQSPGHLEDAIRTGAGRPVGPDDAPALVIVAVPPSATGPVLAESSREFPLAAITDVASVKAGPLAEAVRLGADPARLVGGHPMAGREVSGPLAARADLLDDRLWVLTPLEESSPETLLQVRRAVSACGAYAVEMDPKSHDRAVALVSHAPQVLASVLAAQLLQAQESQVRIAGQGLRDMTRIAGSDPRLWADILAMNAAEVAPVLEAVAAELESMSRAIRAGAAIEVEGVLATGRSGRGRIPGKHGALAKELAVVPVMVADRPGELARLFAAIADTGINLEDIRIDHVLGRPSGLVELTIGPEARESLVAALLGSGFDARA